MAGLKWQPSGEKWIAGSTRVASRRRSTVTQFRDLHRLPVESAFHLSATMSIRPPIHRRKGGSVEVVDSKYAVDLATQQSYSENIFLFVPNLIGQ